ncbi:MAG: T9SS type A sorting domain-containing protein [Sphingomonadales bacterium]|nr:T9SS type A sorting domain-containing protein [Sphingomonadales bacterium]
MHAKLLVSSFFTFLLILSFESHHNLAITYPTGAPAGSTGSPTDVNTCNRSGCHGASPQTGATGLFSLNTTNNQYVPGREYVVSVSIDGSGRKGFQISPQNASTGALMGSLVNTTTTGAAGTQIVGSGKYITHIQGPTANPSTWSFKWIAPAAGSGPVTLYGAFVNGRNTGLRLQHIPLTEGSSTSVQENGRIRQFRVFPNPVLGDKFQISFHLERREWVQIGIFDITGRRVREVCQELMEPGQQQFAVETRQSFAPGLYFVQIEAGKSRSTQKLLVR